MRGGCRTCYFTGRRARVRVRLSTCVLRVCAHAHFRLAASCRVRAPLTPFARLLACQRRRFSHSRESSTARIFSRWCSSSTPQMTAALTSCAFSTATARRVAIRRRRPTYSHGNSPRPHTRTHTHRREQIKSFAGTRKLFSTGVKLVILDEADAMTHDAQFALRRVIEKFTRTTRFCIVRKKPRAPQTRGRSSSNPPPPPTPRNPFSSDM